GLLPGSRSSEIDRLLPVLLAAAKRLSSQSPCRFVLVRAPSVAESRLKSALKEAGIEMPIVSEERFSAVAENHLALCASGTATLELGLLGTPMIVVYRVGIVSYILGRLLIRVPEISLVNLVLGERVVPELIQRSATPETIARESEALLRDRSRIDAMRLRLADLRPLLGKSGASRRAAEQVASVLSGGEAA
ncbi:MAG: lipid-A-disaccharide synthase, partial [Acidobacteriota bacterium]|nr:lipid-A-disaccharide synthase [Acidobacteriota bacterium]